MSCIESGGEPLSSGEEGPHDLEVVIALRESRRRGGVRVDLPITDRSQKKISYEVMRYGGDSMAEAFRTDASPLPPLIGEQALDGTVVFKFESVAAGLLIEDETILVVSVAYGGNLKGDDYAAKGVYLAVTYRITN